MVRIRKLVARDYRAVKRIEGFIVDEYLAYLRETGEEDPIEWWITPEYFNHYVRTQASYVAEVDRKLVGFILVQPTSFVHGAGRELWLEYIAVRPASRREGIGTKLMSTVIEFAKTRNISLLYTALNPNNKESIQFLTAHGFELKDWKEATKKLSHWLAGSVTSWNFNCSRVSWRKLRVWEVFGNPGTDLDLCPLITDCVDIDLILPRKRLENSLGSTIMFSLAGFSGIVLEDIEGSVLELGYPETPP